MTTHDDLDDRIRDQLRAEAPGRAPAGLLEATMARIDTTQRHRSRFLGGSTGPMLAAAAVLLLAVVAGTQLAGLVGRGPAVGTSPSPTASATESTPVPSSGEPSPGATPPPSPPPSAEADARLLLRLVAGGGGPTNPSQLMPWFTLMSDGTVIWQAVPPAAETGSLQVRQLTPEGLAALRDQLLGMGLLTESATYELEQRPDAPQAPGHGVLVYFFTSGLGDGEDPARITSVQWLGDEEEETYYQPSPERRALDELATSLRDPESLVDADAWEGPPQPYAAADYQLVLTPQRDVPPFDTTDASEIPWPFDEPLDAFGEEVGIGPPVSRCGVMGSEQAAPIVEALADHGFGEVGLDRVTIGSLDWAEGSGIVEVFLLPVMPDGYPACAEQVDY